MQSGDRLGNRDNTRHEARDLIIESQYTAGRAASNTKRLPNLRANRLHEFCELDPHRLEDSDHVVAPWSGRQWLLLIGNACDQLLHVLQQREGGRVFVCDRL
jgi:hypothetical protein